MYLRLAETARRLVEKFGGPMTLQVVNQSAYDPATGTAALPASSHQFVGVKLDYQQREIDGKLVLVGDQKVYMPAALSPKFGDLILVDGSVFKVIRSKPLAPGGVLVFSEVQVRG